MSNVFFIILVSQITDGIIKLINKLAIRNIRNSKTVYLKFCNLAANFNKSTYAKYIHIYWKPT